MNSPDARPRPLSVDLARGLTTRPPVPLPGVGPLAVDIAEVTDDTFTLAVTPANPGDVIARVLTAVTANPRTLAAALIVLSRSTIGTADRAEFSRAVYELAVDPEVVAALAVEITAEQAEALALDVKACQPDGCRRTPCVRYAVTAGLCTHHTQEARS